MLIKSAVAEWLRELVGGWIELEQVVESSWVDESVLMMEESVELQTIRVLST